MLHENPDNESGELVHENQPVIIINSRREAFEGPIDVQHHLLVILVAFDRVQGGFGGHFHVLDHHEAWPSFAA